MNFNRGEATGKRFDGLTSLVLRRCFQEMWLGYTYAIGMVLSSGCQAQGPGQEKIAHLDAKDWSLTFQELNLSNQKMYISEFVNELFEDLDSDNICFEPRLFHLSATDSGSFFEKYCSSLKDGSC